ncbi:MAG: DinB family protein [Phycisphaerales bacterium]
MPGKLPWVQRTFTFDYPVEVYPDVIDRFRGTPARIEDKVRRLPTAALTFSDGRGWTIQENIGHLLDLEPLWDGRLDDFLAGRAALRAADMTNAATRAAGHNARPIADLLGEFRASRERQAARVDALDESDFARTAVRPRLQQPMRLVDALAFVCAHDDYHLARMTEIARGFGARRS